jgi:hypothetical protein
MPKVFAVDHAYAVGAWSFHPGEILAEEELALRGVDPAAIPTRAAIREISSLDDLEPAEGRGVFGPAAQARAIELLTAPEPAELPADPDPTDPELAED